MKIARAVVALSAAAAALAAGRVFVERGVFGALLPRMPMKTNSEATAPVANQDDRADLSLYAPRGCIT